ncbi:MAG: single-stranded DNA-binding protein [Clostridiales bacterium]|jgi:single-strand DNA-binding protein|nr:single-stranded DNA-binding protein [Clostridiales bacterium]
MNKCFFIGNLTRDPEHKTTGTGVSVCNFSVAVNRTYQNANGEREADFINIVAWRGLADNCSKYLTKGSKVCVVGQMQNRSYDDKEGNKRYVTEIIADDVEFITPKSESGGGGYAQQGGGERAPQSNRKVSELEAMDADDDLPF